jgi:hypothetical protein
MILSCLSNDLKKILIVIIFHHIRIIRANVIIRQPSVLLSNYEIPRKRGMKCLPLYALSFSSMIETF